MNKKIFAGSLLLGACAMGLPFYKINKVAVYANYVTNNCEAYCLLEKKSGKMLIGKNETKKLPIASVTKLMTILLTLESLDKGDIKLDDNVMVSERAEGMGGSQIFLDANENYKVGELLKSVIVASANDSSVALAEHLAGSEINFVRVMNERASNLNMNNTHYDNCTGLPSNNGYSCAYDQALLLRKVLNYPTYIDYCSIWNENFVHPSGRTTQMTNTNKLVRHYSGCLGGKTGSTSEAKYCLAVGAERNDMQNIAVVLGADTTKNRFKIASDLLNYGFDNYESKTIFKAEKDDNLRIAIKGQNRSALVKAEKDFSIVTKKGETPNYDIIYNIPNQLTKVECGDIVGNVEIIVDGQVVEKINLISCETYDEASVWDYFKELIEN